jgi:hypothetical protein
MKKLITTILIITTLGGFAQVDTIKFKGFYKPNWPITIDSSTGIVFFKTEYGKIDTAYANYNDTISVLLLVSIADTVLTGVAFVIPAWEVRSVIVKNEYAYDNPNKEIYIGDGMFSTTLMARIPRLVKNTYPSHIKYLAMNREPLPTNYIVWMKHNTQ